MARGRGRVGRLMVFPHPSPEEEDPDPAPPPSTSGRGPPPPAARTSSFRLPLARSERAGGREVAPAAEGRRRAGGADADAPDADAPDDEALAAELGMTLQELALQRGAMLRLYSSGRGPGAWDADAAPPLPPGLDPTLPRPLPRPVTDADLDDLLPPGSRASRRRAFESSDFLRVAAQRSGAAPASAEALARSALLGAADWERERERERGPLLYNDNEDVSSGPSRLCSEDENASVDPRSPDIVPHLVPRGPPRRLASAGPPQGALVRWMAAEAARHGAAGAQRGERERERERASRRAAVERATRESLAAVGGDLGGPARGWEPSRGRPPSDAGDLPVPFFSAAQRTLARPWGAPAGGPSPVLFVVRPGGGPGPEGDAGGTGGALSPRRGQLAVAPALLPNGRSAEIGPPGTSGAAGARGRGGGAPGGGGPEDPPGALPPPLSCGTPSRRTATASPATGPRPPPRPAPPRPRPAPAASPPSSPTSAPTRAPPSPC